MKQIHISTPDGRQTIYPEDQIRSLWQQGLLVDSALYWQEGMMEWRPLREYFTPAPAKAVGPPPISPPTGQPSAPSASPSLPTKPAHAVYAAVLRYAVGIALCVV